MARRRRADRGRPEACAWPRTPSFKGERCRATSPPIPLGYEVKAKGPRGPDGSLLAGELEAKPNGLALFEEQRPT